MTDNKTDNKTDSKAEKSTLPNYRWIKFEIEYLNEPDFMQLSEGAAGAYLKLYLLAGKADAGGLLCNRVKVFTTDDLAWYFRCPPESITKHLEELTTKGFMTNDGEGFKITRFLEEQGPGDDARRVNWKDRQSKHRARAKGEADSYKEREEDLYQEVEVEVESHGDVTVTSKGLPPPPSGDDIKTEIFQNYWKNFTGRKLGKQKMQEFFKVMEQEPDITDWALRLRDCLDVWKGLVTDNHKYKNWSLSNPDAVMELYPIPNLEERMQREGLTWKNPIKEEEKKERLKTRGLLKV